MLGKKMKGSDIIMEAGLISSGSVAGVMQGKHYDRAIHCHKVVLEALESLRVTKLFPTQEHPLIAVSNDARKKIDALFQHPSGTSLSEVLEDAKYPVGTVYLSSFTSFARDSKWGCRL